eukprot:6883896-Pyramimonas_sp.AAC.1
MGPPAFGITVMTVCRQLCGIGASACMTVLYDWGTVRLSSVGACFNISALIPIVSGAFPRL